MAAGVIVLDLVDPKNIKNIGELKNGLESLSTTLQNFDAMFKSINIGQVAHEFSTSINDLLATIYNTITQTDWASYATQLGQGLTNIFRNIDWALLGVILGEFVKTAIDMIGMFFRDMDWSTVFFGIVEALVNIDWLGIIFTALGAIDNIITSIMGNSTIATILESIAISIGLVTAAIKGYELAMWLSKVATDAFQLSMAMLTLPIVWIVAAIALVVAIIITLIKNWDTVKEVSARCWEAIKAAWSAAAEWINSTVVQPVMNFFRGLWDGIKNTFSAVGQWFSGIFSNAWIGIKAVWSGVIAFFGSIWTGIKGAFSSVTDWFRGVFSSAWQAVKNVFSAGGQIFNGIKDGILNGLKVVVNGIISGINKVVAVPFNGINAALRSIRGVSILGAKPFGWIREISVPQIPQLARGAVLPPNKPFLAMLGDQRHGTNIETPLDTMVAAFKTAFHETRGNDDIKPVIIKLDERVLAEVLLKRVQMDTFAGNGVSFV